MATVTYNEPGGISYRDDPRDGAQFYTIVARVDDLDTGSAAELIAQAMRILPQVGDPGPIGNTVVYSRSPEPVLPCDAIVRISYGPPIAGSLYGPPKLRLGTTVEMSGTEFDAANRRLPFDQRKPIVVRYDPTEPGAVPPWNGVGGKVDPYAKTGRLPFYAQHSTATFTTTLRYNPGPLSRSYSSMTNSTAWKGEAVGTVLCLGIEGDSTDGEVTFRTDFNFMYDPDNGFFQYLRYLDLQGLPVTGLTPQQIQGRNGIQDVAVQGSIDFHNLPI